MAHHKTDIDSETPKNPGLLEGHLLIATPGIVESCFGRAVVYVCAHSDQGAMGVIINQEVTAIRYKDLIAQLNLPTSDAAQPIPIHFGGPVEPARGFVIHSADYVNEDSLRGANNTIAVTSNINILKEIALGRGPVKSMLALGYAGWGPGQLEAECEAGHWISVPATPDLVFDAENDHKWHLSARALGVDLARLSTTVGHA